ncbi:MAG: peptide deformylase [Candidatus Schekmanbacteria bacterium]|nr:MAG: peptide deformylase [Candidatus Schekmanbacteria bacterium]
MSVLEIVKYPSRILRTESTPIENIDGEIAKLVDDMLETMYDAPGIGLAAPQVGKNIRLIVLDTGQREGEKGEVYKLINPEIEFVDGENEVFEEGCLSVPNISEKVVRPDKIIVRAVTLDEKEIEFEASGLLSRVIQHEVDHLNGKLFIDRVSKIKKELIKMKLRKMQKD